jgi:hypothetical protein
MRLAIATAASDATPIIARPKQTSPGIEYEGKSGWSIKQCSSQRRAGAQASDLITTATGYVVMRGMLPCPGADTWSILTAFGRVTKSSAP